MSKQVIVEVPEELCTLLNYKLFKHHSSPKEFIKACITSMVLGEKVVINGTYSVTCKELK